MLTDLIIANFAIIDRLHLTLEAGFTVLTGETGAGKSILIDALSLLMGERARVEMIRSGEESASVEGIFSLPDDHPVFALLREQGFSSDELIIRRAISRSGKNRIFINGSPAGLAQLAEVGALLIRIYGQNEQQGLRDPDLHLQLLDQFGGYGDLLQRWNAAYLARQVVVKELAAIQLDEQTRRQRIDLLRYQVQEIASAAPREGEEEELLQERSMQQHAEEITRIGNAGYEALYAGDEAVTSTLSRILTELDSVRSAGGEIVGIAETLRNSLYEIEDAAGRLRSFAEDVVFDPTRLDAIEQRLIILERLRRKYGHTATEILAHAAAAEEELELLEGIDSARGKLASRMEEAEKNLHREGLTLSAARHDAAGRMTAAVENELKALAMPNARLQFRFEQLQDPGPLGMERGEFLLSANLGEDAKPLHRVASGGEMSRIMLALKSSLPDGDDVRTVVYDEVDAGIGGKTATSVGERLRGASAGRQVLCITHLPQVAAFADTHCRVEKRESGGRTLTGVVMLDLEARIDELARMLGGAHVSEHTRKHALEMIRQSTAA